MEDVGLNSALQVMKNGPFHQWAFHAAESRLDSRQQDVEDRSSDWGLFGELEWSPLDEHRRMLASVPVPVVDQPQV